MPSPVRRHARQCWPDAGCRTVKKPRLLRGFFLGIDMCLYFHNSGYMDKKDALDALAALAQDTRLDAFRLLVRHEPDGLAAGELAARLDVPQNTLSSHLAILARAGLVRSQRQGRSVIYRADIDWTGALSLYLIEDCCGNHLEPGRLRQAGWPVCCPGKS